MMNTTDAAVDAEFVPLLPDTGSTGARDTKYLRTIDLYWHMKTILAKAITVRDAAQTEMARKIEFIQLQKQLTNKKLNIMAAKQGIIFNADVEETTQVPQVAPSSV
jgi:hypothetical protein